MVGSRYPFRDPPRRSDEPASGNRLDRPRDQTQGNRRPRADRPREEGADVSAPEATPPDLSALHGQVEALVRMITATDVTELQVESGAVKILIRRGVPPAAPPLPQPMPGAAPPVADPAPAGAPVAAALAPPAGPPPLPAVPGHGAPPPALAGPGESVIVSPMVGTFYAAPAPQEPAYVHEGDEVLPGQTIGIIEAMKMMNQIEAEVQGRVVRILVRDAQGVEYGQPLIVIAES